MRSATSCRRSKIKVEKLPDAYELEFFPAKTPFSKTYSVRFVAPAATGDFAGITSGAITFGSPVPSAASSYLAGLSAIELADRRSEQRESVSIGFST